MSRNPEAMWIELWVDVEKKAQQLCLLNGEQTLRGSMPCCGQYCIVPSTVAVPTTCQCQQPGSSWHYAARQRPHLQSGAKRVLASQRRIANQPSVERVRGTTVAMMLSTICVCVIFVDATRIVLHSPAAVVSDKASTAHSHPRRRLGRRHSPIMSLYARTCVRVRARAGACVPGDALADVHVSAIERVDDLLLNVFPRELNRDRLPARTI